MPEEVLTDNGKQFTDRFGKGGEVLFDRICRDNAIAHRLTQPASPTTTGRVERFHQSLRRELLDHCGRFADVAAAQAAIDEWVGYYNTRRPHQSLDMACPSDRFTAAGEGDDVMSAGGLLPLRLPGSLVQTLREEGGAASQPAEFEPSAAVPWTHGPVEFDRVVPPSGNMEIRGKQFWLGTARSGVTVTFWADTDMIHLLIAGARIKSVRSHLSVNDLAALAATGGRAAGPSPLPPIEPGCGAVEVDRTVNRGGHVSLGQHVVLAAEILAGRRVSVRVEADTLHFFDPQTRDLLRTRPNPLTPADVTRLRGARPAGPAPQASTVPVIVQRRASNSGVIMVAGQKISLGRPHARQTVSVEVGTSEFRIEVDGTVRAVRRQTDQPVRSVKAHRPRHVAK